MGAVRAVRNATHVRHAKVVRIATHANVAIGLATGVILAKNVSPAKGAVRHVRLAMPVNHVMYPAITATDVKSAQHVMGHVSLVNHAFLHKRFASLHVITAMVVKYAMAVKEHAIPSVQHVYHANIAMAEDAKHAMLVRELATHVWLAIPVANLVMLRAMYSSSKRMKKDEYKH